MQSQSSCILLQVQIKESADWFTEGRQKKNPKKQLDQSDDGINFGSVGKWKLSKEQTRSPSTQDSTQMSKDRPAFLNRDNDKMKRGGVILILILILVTDGQGSVMYALLLCF